MSMFSDRNKMEPILEVNELNNFKFKIGDLVHHEVKTSKFSVCRNKTGIIEGQRIMYARRFYDVRFYGHKHLQTIIETDLSK